MDNPTTTTFNTSKAINLSNSKPQVAVLINQEHIADLDLFRQYEASKVYETTKLGRQRMVSSDKKLRNKLAERNAKLVTYLVNKFYKKQHHLELRDDLIQEGSLGLLNAIDGFNVSRGYKFSTYCSWHIVQTINNFLADQKPHLKVPPHVRTAQNKLLKQLKEQGLTIKDLPSQKASNFGISEKMFKSIGASLRAKWISYLDERVGNSGNDMTIGDMIVSTEDGAEQYDTLLDNNLLMRVAKRTLNKLTEREKLVILLRYNAIPHDSVMITEVQAN